MTNDNKPQTHKTKKIPFKLILVMAILGSFFGIFWRTLTSNTDTTTEVLDKNIPHFRLADLNNPDIFITHKDIKENAPALVNIWASWCAPCRNEHKIITKLVNVHKIKIFGLNYKDKPENGANFLTKYGNPYVKVMNDADGMATLNWGIRGVPETFIINKNGKITYRHTGEIKEADIENIVKEFKKASE